MKVLFVGQNRDFVPAHLEIHRVGWIGKRDVKAKRIVHGRRIIASTTGKC